MPSCGMILRKSGAALLLAGYVCAETYPIVEHVLRLQKNERVKCSPETYCVSSHKHWRYAHTCVRRVKHFSHKLKGKRTMLFVDSASLEQSTLLERYPYDDVVLVRGCPVRLMQRFHRKMWVDYRGTLSALFEINVLPSRVVLHGNRCEIYEGLCG